MRREREKKKKRNKLEKSRVTRGAEVAIATGQRRRNKEMDRIVNDFHMFFTTKYIRCCNDLFEQNHRNRTIFFESKHDEHNS